MFQSKLLFLMQVFVPSLHRIFKKIFFDNLKKSKKLTPHNKISLLIA